MASQKAQAKENIVELAEDVIASKAEEISAKIVQAVAKDTGNLVLDFSDVDNIDAIGLGIIVAACNTLKKKDGMLTLINVSDELCGFFNALRLDQAFEVRSK